MNKSKRTPPADVMGLGYLFNGVAIRWQKLMNDALTDLELSTVQLSLMWGISELTSAEPEPLTQTRLASFVYADVMLTSKTLRSLEERGLVDRQPHPHDTRARSLVLTKEGATLLKRAQKVVGKIDQDFFEAVPAKDKLRKSLLATLEQ